MVFAVVRITGVLRHDSGTAHRGPPDNFAAREALLRAQLDDIQDLVVPPPPGAAASGAATAPRTDAPTQQPRLPAEPEQTEDDDEMDEDPDDEDDEDEDSEEDASDPEL